MLAHLKRKLNAVSEGQRWWHIWHNKMAAKEVKMHNGSTLEKGKICTVSSFVTANRKCVSEKAFM